MRVVDQRQRKESQYPLCRVAQGLGWRVAEEEKKFLAQTGFRTPGFFQPVVSSYTDYAIAISIAPLKYPKL
jgi:hypothetical protein